MNELTPDKSQTTIHISNEQYFPDQEKIAAILARNFDEVRGWLPTLADDITLRFTTENFIPETGESGFTQNTNTFVVAIDSEYPDKEKQRGHLREMVFHESLHAVQGYTGETGPFTPIDSAIYEGMAMAFGREMTGASPMYGDYSETEPYKLEAWFTEMKAITAEEYAADGGALWARWAFYDEVSGERWRLYKVGAWLLDRYQAVTKKTATELVDVTPKDVLQTLAV